MARFLLTTLEGEAKNSLKKIVDSVKQLCEYPSHASDGFARTT